MNIRPELETKIRFRNLLIAALEELTTEFVDAVGGDKEFQEVAENFLDVEGNLDVEGYSDLMDKWIEELITQVLRMYVDEAGD